MSPRVLGVVVVVLLVVLAGCSSGGPAVDEPDAGGDDGANGGSGGGGDGAGDGGSGDGASGDGSGDGAGGSDGGADGGAGSLDSGEWTPFQFDQAGTYTYEVFLEGEGDGTLVWDVTDVSEEEVTIKMSYDVGGETFEKEFTGSRFEMPTELMLTPAGQLFVLTVITPGSWYAGRDLKVGTGWSFTTDQGSQSFQVTGTDSVAGVSCFTSEMKINDTVILEGCFAPGHGLQPYSAYYEEDGTLQMRMTLVEYKARN